MKKIYIVTMQDRTIFPCKETTDYFSSKSKAQKKVDEYIKTLNRELLRIDNNVYSFIYKGVPIYLVDVKEVELK